MSDEPPSSQPVPPSRIFGPFGRVFSARPSGSPYPKAELLPRLLARLTDCMIAAFLPLTTGQVGIVLAALYILFADGMMRGQSPGKKLLGIKVVSLPSYRGVDYRESALRNFFFALALLLSLVPMVGHLLFWAVGPTLIAFEGWQVLNDTLGLRMGDLFANTQVVDTKALVGQQVPPMLRSVRPESRVRSAVRVLWEPPRPRFFNSARRRRALSCPSTLRVWS